MHRKILKISLIILASLSAIILLGLIIFLIFQSSKNYTPSTMENLEISGEPQKDIIPLGLHGIYSWNIGYCGLGKEMDFFYEGGKMVRPTEEQYCKYRDGIIYSLSTFGASDFILLQEVDTNSKRSYSDNQAKRLQMTFKNYCSSFAINYDAWVPLPVLKPMGKVKAGMMTLSKFKALEAIRYAYPSSYSWPKKLFMLDRCFILSRFNVENGKQLVLINLHNSAFDDAADMRAQELEMLKNTLSEEFAKGNYVIAGGDWNQNPVSYKVENLNADDKGYAITPAIPDGWLPEGWRWAFDNRYPTNRNVNEPFTKGKTGTTIIDFYIVSPNVTIGSVSTQNLGFAFSDHNPVGMMFELK